MPRTVERSYRRSHRWITFHLDLRPLHPDVWMLLGEARSKIDHLSLALLRPEVADQMNLVYLAKGAHATTAIEGNTLSEDDVIEIIEGRHDTPPSQEYLAQEATNIVTAFNRIKDHLIGDGRAEITPEAIRQFNRDVLDGLELDDWVKPGETRDRSVVVGNYRGAPPEDCDHLLERLCTWLNGDDFAPPSEEWQVPRTRKGRAWPSVSGLDSPLRRRKRPDRAAYRASDSAGRWTPDAGDSSSKQPLQRNARGVLPPATAGECFRWRRVAVHPLCRGRVRRWDPTAARAGLESAVRRPVGAVHLSRVRGYAHASQGAPAPLDS